jgi:peptidoglycan hydrolase-like protein with peptidoglycan-binding domain
VKSQAAERRATREAELQAEKEQVANDQQALKDLGYYSGAVNGLTGSATRAAISAFRAGNGLAKGDTLDAWSRGVLTGGTAVAKTKRSAGAQAGSQAPAAAAAAAAAAAERPSREPASGGRPAVAGAGFRLWGGGAQPASTPPSDQAASAEAPPDLQLLADQRMLKALGFYQGTPDGRRGGPTEQAIKDFSLANGFGAKTVINSHMRTLLHSGAATSSWEAQSSAAPTP